jgi:hypothetical protein
MVEAVEAISERACERVRSDITTPSCIAWRLLLRDRLRLRRTHRAPSFQGIERDDEERRHEAAWKMLVGASRRRSSIRELLTHPSRPAFWIKRKQHCVPRVHRRDRLPRRFVSTIPSENGRSNFPRGRANALDATLASCERVRSDIGIPPSTSSPSGSKAPSCMAPSRGCQWRRVRRDGSCRRSDGDERRRRGSTATSMATGPLVSDADG